jgi:RimJ/RimL family protein N-acetyltransferase
MIIHGNRVNLRDKPKETDFEDYFRWWNLEEWKYYDQPDQPFKPISREAFLELWNQYKSKSKTTVTSHQWQVETKEGGHIGWVNYYQHDRELRQAFVGICLPEEDTWNRGYGTEALTLLIEYLFEEMDLKAVKTATWTGNHRMVRCAQKLGFLSFELMPHRVEVSVREEPLERIVFSILRDEWNELRKNP